MKDQEQSKSKFQRYLRAEYKPEELDETLDNFSKEIEGGQLKELISVHMESTDEIQGIAEKSIAAVISNTDDIMRDFISQKLQRKSSPIKYIRRWLPSAAAVILISVGIGLYLYVSKTSGSEDLNSKAQATYGANREKAVLTLDDGRKIELSNDHEGIIIADDNIMYNDSTSVTKSSGGSNSNASNVKDRALPPVSNLTLTTPRGSKYRVTLPDGTNVWLNAGSSLKYPSRFTGSERRITLDGEAYFEVASIVNPNTPKGTGSERQSNQKMPFIIKSGKQEVKVLGTHFNISAYADESEIKTTLVEGSVQVSIMDGVSERTSARILTPSEQSIVSTSTKDISVRTVNTKDYTAWRESLLIFDKQSLRSILLTLGRWYDFQVDNTKIPEVSLSGTVPTNVKLSEVINLLEETSKVKLIIVGSDKQGERRVTVRK